MHLIKKSRLHTTKVFEKLLFKQNLRKFQPNLFKNLYIDIVMKL